MDQPTPWRFSLRTLLGVTAFVAVASAPVGWLGELYVISVTISLLFFFGVIASLRPGRPGLFVASCLIAIVGIVLLFSQLLLVQLFGTLLVCALTQSRQERVRMRVGLCAAVMVLAYLPAFSYAIAADREIIQLRERFPLVSLFSRLPFWESGDRVALSPSQIKNLEARKRRIRGDGELAYQLQKLHQASYARFARSAGFGAVRLRFVSPQRIEEEMALRVSSEEHRLPTPLPEEADVADAVGVHEATEAVFLSRARIGYVEDLFHVAGFLGHGFARLPFDDEWEEGPEPRTGAWSLNRLDLIGLVLNEEPAAYVTEGLPNMEELRDATTRDLDEFEATALERLRGSDDVVVQESRIDGELQVRMLGAVRAGESCAACHQTSRGTLLGAFSYELTRTLDAVADSPAAEDGEPTTSVVGGESENALN